MVSRRSFVTGILPLSVLVGMASGCGGGADLDVSKPVEVTDELKRQAEASDAYFNSQQKTKKKGSSEEVK